MSEERSLNFLEEIIEEDLKNHKYGQIVTRFPRTFTNLQQALGFVNQALLFDNSSADEPCRFVAEFIRR